MAERERRGDQGARPLGGLTRFRLSVAFLVLLPRRTRTGIVAAHLARFRLLSLSGWRHELRELIIELTQRGRTEEVPFPVGPRLVGPRLAWHEDEVCGNRAA